jgi:hypothetical protein
MRFLSQLFRPNDGKTWIRAVPVAGRSRWSGRRFVVEALEPRQLLSGPGGGSDPLTLTAAGLAAGFGLTTFATGFPERSDGLGPMAVVFPASGGVLVDDGPGNVRLFPSDTDGQDATTAPPVSGAGYGTSDSSGMARVGNNLYLMLSVTNRIAQINDDGTVKQIITSSVPAPDGVAINPLNGHLFVSGFNSAIYDVDPVTGTASVLVEVSADGLAFDPSTGILYAALYNAAGPGDRVQGFDITTKAMVFDSGTISGGPDGIALGKGPVAGNLFVNTNGGTLVEVNLATAAQTIIASGGSRGDFVTVDPNNATLFVTQSDRIMRLIPGVFVIPPHLLTTTTTLDIAPKMSSFGQPVTLTAVVTTAGSGIPTGTVTFMIDGQEQAPVSVTEVGSSDQATFTTSTLTPGTHTITATYSGDTTFAPSGSNPVSQVVQSDGPRIVSVQVPVKRHGARGQPATLVLTFDEALDPGRADDLANYDLVVLGRKRPPTLALHSAVYGPATQTLTLTTVRRLDRRLRYRLTVVGTGPSGVTDTHGNLLDGQQNGQPGSDFVLSVTARNFVTT